MLTIKWAVAHAMRRGWSISQVDIDSAYLNGIIDREKYIHIPQGFEGDNKTHAAKLNKTIYGLVNAANYWFTTITKYIKENGFTDSPREECVFVKVIPKNITILMTIYVDDFLITSNSKDGVEHAISLLEKKFQLKRLGFPQKFIGIQFDQITQSSLFLHQEDLIQSILENYDFDKDFQPTILMIPPKEWKISEGEVIPNYHYRAVIGSLQYLSSMTRIDIAQPLGVLARAQSNPVPVHHKALGHLPSYLNANRNQGLIFKRNYSNKSKIELYADADHAGDRPSRRSTTGYILIYHDAVIH